MNFNHIATILFVLVSISIGYAIYFLGKNKTSLALWLTTITIILIILGTSSLVQQGLINKKNKLEEVVYYGQIKPSNEEITSSPPNTPESTFKLLLGDDLLVLAAQSENFILKKENIDTPFLSIKTTDNHLLLNASIVDSENKNVVKIIDNEFQAFPEASFNPKQPDEHSLIVRDGAGQEVLNLRYLNKDAIKITGRFYIPNYENPVIISKNDGIIFPNGSSINKLTFDVTNSKGGIIVFK